MRANGSKLGRARRCEGGAGELVDSISMEQHPRVSHFTARKRGERVDLDLRRRRRRHLQLGRGDAAHDGLRTGGVAPPALAVVLVVLVLEEHVAVAVEGAHVAVLLPGGLLVVVLELHGDAGGEEGIDEGADAGWVVVPLASVLEEGGMGRGEGD